MNVEQFIKDFQDYLAPRLDTYEQAIYLYAYRHSRLVGNVEVVIGFKSARKKMAFGIGEKGKPPSEGTCYEKLRSLESKGFLKVLDTERSGTRLKIFLPDEIPDLISVKNEFSEIDIEKLDFFADKTLRQALLTRENNKCFYCLKKINSNNYIIEHVESRPIGSNNYRNLVAACRQCNNRKGSLTAENFVRVLYRQGLLSENDTESRLSTIKRLRDGKLRPDITGYAPKSTD